MPSIVEYLSGFTNQGNMHDYAHASRLYLDDTFALAPKTSWIYYVSFSINNDAIREVQWNEQKRGLEAGMLVKAVDLPKFKIQVETLNQYNRKTLIQQKISYEPISMTFHDDMSNVTNSLWVNYFRYYYQDTWHGQNVKTDRTFKTGDKIKAGYGNTKYQSGPTTKLPDGRPGGHGKFGLNNNQGTPFFNAITIYQLNAKRFTSYVLINPLIESWEHDQLDQSSGSKFAQSRCTFGYETVFYGEGRVIRNGSPEGFATFHYDQTPSPLSIAGGGNSSIFGPGGILSGTEDLFGQTDKLLSGNSISSLGSIASIGIQGSNLIRNYKNISEASLKAEGQSILNSAIKGAIAGGGPGSGLLGGIIGGGLGSLGKSLGFGPQTGTLLNGANFRPNSTEATVDLGTQVGPTSFYEGTPAALKANDLVLSGMELEQLDNPTAVENALIEQDAKRKDILNKIEVASKQQVEVDAAVNRAIAADGPAAGIAVREQYASQGYIAPQQYQAQLQVITDNQRNILDNADAQAKLSSNLPTTERTALGNAQAILDKQFVGTDGPTTISITRTVDARTGIQETVEVTTQKVVGNSILLNKPLDQIPGYKESTRDYKTGIETGPPSKIGD